jgi:hypothetical protein
LPNPRRDPHPSPRHSCRRANFRAIRAMVSERAPSRAGAIRAPQQT